jgi:hypothetical protein
VPLRLYPLRTDEQLTDVPDLLVIPVERVISDTGEVFEDLSWGAWLHAVFRTAEEVSLLSPLLVIYADEIVVIYPGPKLCL